MFRSWRHVRLRPLTELYLVAPGFLLPGGVHLQAMLRPPCFSSRGLLEMLLGQKIWHIRPRCLFISALMSRQHPDPNNRFAVTQHHLKAALFGPPDGAELREAALFHSRFLFEPRRLHKTAKVKVQDDEETPWET